MARRAKPLGGALAVLATSAAAWGCGGATSSPTNEGHCDGGDAACEMSVVPKCADDASCGSSASCAGGGCVDGAGKDGSGSAISDSAPPECDGGPCPSCVGGGDCTPPNPCHRGITECIGGAPYCVDMLTNAAAGTGCGGGNACDNGVCMAPCDGSPSCSPSSTTCPGPGCDGGTTCSGSACDAGVTCPTAGMSCPLVGLCYYGVIQCISGQALCETGMKVPNGSSCGSPGQICVNGDCNTQIYVRAEMLSFSTSSTTIDSTLFTFTDILSYETASAFTATLDWGDGSQSAATIDGSAGMFTVSGSHSYDLFGDSTITVTLTDTVTGTVVTQTCKVSVGVTEFSTETPGNSITAGPDGNLWFTEPYTNSIASITTAGVVSTYYIPTLGAQPATITGGPDGNVWFTETNGDKIGSITPLGVITEFDIPTLNAQPNGITAGPDGNLWFTESAGDNIGRITPAGTVTEFPILIAGAAPTQITAGPDGNLWFTTQSGVVGKVTPAGEISTFAISSMDQPNGITAGPDGNLWFADESQPSLGKVTPEGVVTEVGIGMDSLVVTPGPDGNLWFTGGSYGNTTNFGKMTPAGVATLYALDFPPWGLTAGPDGNMWMTWADGIAMVKP
jgi:streptogramin lyase